MKPFLPLNAIEQLVAHLRNEVQAGGLGDTIPGVRRLAKDLGVGSKSAAAALLQLEHEGLLSGKGARRGRLIAPATGVTTKRRLRVAILLYEPLDRGLDYMIELSHELESAGHVVFYPPKSLAELRMDVGRVARMVAKTDADAWLVLAGSSEVLEWFATRDKPALALFGRRRGLRLASVGPDKPPAMVAVTRALLDLGHSRIVLMVRRMRRLPKPGATEQAFLDTLAAHGITPGPYHLPDWNESVDGFYARLDALFRYTPPTALILDEVPVFAAAQQFLARKGIRVPEEVSLVCTDYDALFEWARPRISHIRWDRRPVVKRVVQWASNVSQGKSDLGQTLTPAEFIKGGTIGPGS